MDIFAALADPTRRQIVESLATGEHSFGELADQFEMSRPAVSQHLKILKEASIVLSRPDAQRRLYRLNSSALEELETWVHRVHTFWTQSLDKLEQILVEDDGEEK